MVAIAGLVGKRHKVGIQGDGLVRVQLVGTPFLYSLEFQEGWKEEEAEICQVFQFGVFETEPHVCFPG